VKDAMSTASINLVFCMAGLYRRFREAGYETPKYLLPWRGQPVLRHVVGHIATNPVFARCLLVANRREEGSADAILAAVQGLGLGAADLHFIDDTDGQASTARIGLELLDDPRRPVAFHNVDTLIRERDWAAMATQLAASDGYIDVFPADEPVFSYVSLDPAGFVTAIREKVVISSHATSGFYAFRDPQAFLADCQACQTSGGERYLSDVYARMLARGARIAIGGADSPEHTLIFGTPAQYEALCGPHDNAVLFM
jgi:CTP:molybdopterin cytidylyltransferase MocA